MVVKYLLSAALPPSMESLKPKTIAVRKKILEDYVRIYRYKEHRIFISLSLKYY